MNTLFSFLSGIQSVNKPWKSPAETLRSEAVQVYILSYQVAFQVYKLSQQVAL